MRSGSHKLGLRSWPALQIRASAGGTVTGTSLLSVKGQPQTLGGVLFLLKGSQCSAWYSDYVWVLGVGSDR